MEERDHVRVAELFNESPAAIRDDYMVSLVAVYHGRIVAVLRGWLGHPRGHVEMFDVDYSASGRERYTGSVWLLRAFEGLLTNIGARGWTAMTGEQDDAMVRFLTRHGAKALDGRQVVFVKEWAEG